MNRILSARAVIAAVLTVFVFGVPMACQDQAVPTEATSPSFQKNANLNDKHTFADVLLEDDELTVENGIVEAKVKDNKKTTLTTCSYFTADYSESLGYASGEFSSDDPGAVLAFCQEIFADRHV